jgi:hypothetical protein
MLGCRSLTGGAGMLGLLAETPSQQQVLAVRGLQGALQIGELLAVAALELGELPGERGDDAAGLVRVRAGAAGRGAGAGGWARSCSTRSRMAGLR